MTSDEALYEQWVKGDLNAFDALYGRHEKPLFGFLCRQLAVQAEAEDVLHETFIALLESKAPMRTSFRAWMYQVARNLCLNRARTARRGDAAIAIDARTQPVEAEDPHGRLETAQRQTALLAAVQALPATLSELFHLRTRGLSYDELGQVLDVPVGTVKSRMHDLVGRLREEMSR